MGLIVNLLIAGTNTYIINTVQTINDGNYLPAPIVFGTNVGHYGSQPLLNTQVGGDFGAPQLWFWNSNQSKWMGGIQIPGGILGYNHTTQLGPDGNSGHLLVVSNGIFSDHTNIIDNVLSLQNLNSTHYSAWVAVDQFAQWHSAWGWGNNAAPFYRSINYIELHGDKGSSHLDPFYFVNVGSAMSGYNSNGDFLFFNGTTSNPDSVTGLNISARIDINGNTAIGGTIAGALGRANIGPISSGQYWNNMVGTSNNQSMLFGGLQVAINTSPYLNETNDASLEIGIFPYGDYMHLITNGAGSGINTTIINNASLNNPTNTPSNTNIVRSYMKLTNNGVLYYVPLYQ